MTQIIPYGAYEVATFISNTALNMASVRLFKNEIDPRAIARPLLIAAATKLVSLIPYYLSEDVENEAPHPLTGAGYPGVYAVTSAMISNRMSQIFGPMSDITTLGIAALQSLIQHFATTELGARSFCNLDRYNQTELQSKGWGAAAGAWISGIEVVQTLVGREFVTSVIEPRQPSSINKPALLTFFLSVPIISYIVSLNSSLRSSMLGFAAGSSSYAFSIGLMIGATHSNAKHRIAKLATGVLSTLIFTAAYKITAIEYCMDEI